MSESGRQDLSEQIANKITPDSTKSTTEQVTEYAKGALDKVAGTLEPESHKSETQKLGDNIQSAVNDAENKGSSLADTVKAALSNASQSVSENIKAATDFVSGTAGNKVSEAEAKST